MNDLIYYFNMMTDLVVPWLNQIKPESVSIITLPHIVEDVMDISGTKLQFFEHYLQLTMDPTMIEHPVTEEEQKDIQKSLPHCTPRLIKMARQGIKVPCNY